MNLGHSHQKGSEQLLGDFEVVVDRFDHLERLLEQFQTPDFHRLSERLKIERVNHALCDWIKQRKTPCFLLPAVLSYFEKLHALKILENYPFFHFELWLNQSEEVSDEENYQIRAKIAGKWVPRDTYQIYFPIGMGKVFPGSHYVTAHSSPDLDTTVASFWGWVDAFAARVSSGMHLWNVPGGAPSSQIEIGMLFEKIFGKAVFELLAKTRTSLSLSGLDLMTQKDLVRKQTNEMLSAIDHERMQNAVVLVDEQGYYLGDWRNFDVEGVKNVTFLLNNCLQWFENHLHVKLISLFAKENLSLKDLPNFTSAVFLTQIGQCKPAQEFTSKQTFLAQDFLTKVLGLKKGLQSTFEDFARAMKEHSHFEFQEFVEIVESMHQSKLFDSSGFLIENRPRLFHYLEKVIQGLERAIQSVRNYLERLDVALKIKADVYGDLPQYISYRDDVEEIRSKMGNYPYLTVAAVEKNAKLLALGVVHAKEIHQSILGTVSLRDFCNRDETKIPSYLEVISVIDHHKSSLQTFSAPTAIISDAQSSNVLCGEMAFEINDCYSSGTQSREEIQKQIESTLKNLASSSDNRLVQRLLKKLLATERKEGFFIDPMREFVEYLHFFYAILDDTDLLTKVSQRDVECVCHLINRMKSITVRKEVEVINLDDIPQDRTFARKAATRILQNPDVYSLYRKIYLAKEESVDENMQLCSQGKASNLFVDTKEQNGCARVGQTKMFSKNYPVYTHSVAHLRKFWYDGAKDFWNDHPEIDFHMHMVSTVAGAEEMFAGKEQSYAHKDELWIWIPFTEQSIGHLKGFLNAFRTSPQIAGSELEIEFLGSQAKAYEAVFVESFLPIAKKKFDEKSGLSIAVLKYPAGLINSRKAMISPYLPKKVY